MVLTIHSEFSFEDSPTPILSLYFSSLSDVFTWKMVRQREKLFPSLVHSWKNCNPQDWAWLKPGRNHSILASHISAGVPNMWSVFFLPMCITRKPDGKQSYGSWTCAVTWEPVLQAAAESIGLYFGDFYTNICKSFRIRNIWNYSSMLYVLFKTALAVG